MMIMEDTQQTEHEGSHKADTPRDIPSGNRPSGEAMEFFAPCPRGLEDVCALELREQGIRRVRPLESGVSFFGTLRDGYRACLWSRVASRVLLVLSRFPAKDADELYQGVKDIPWEDHLSCDGTFAVDANGMNAQLRNTQFSGMKAKDAVCDRFRDRFGRRPNVDPALPDVQINIAIRNEKATAAIDLAGTTLHHRGYRAAGLSSDAPLKEALAAGILLLAGWKDIARAGGSFVDPMCGSGTLPIEAAMIAGDIAPGILRQHWGFDGWLGHDQTMWDDLLDRADASAEAGRDTIPPISGSDRDPRAISTATQNARRAQLGSMIDLAVADLSCITAPEGGTGLLATNPPFGERFAARAQLPALYASLASRLRGSFPGWKVAIATGDPDLDAGLGMRPEKTIPLFFGRTRIGLRLYTVAGAGQAIPAVEAGGSQADGDVASRPSRPAGATDQYTALKTAIHDAFDAAATGADALQGPTVPATSSAAASMAAPAVSSVAAPPAPSVTVPVVEVGTPTGVERIAVAEANTVQFADRLKKVFAKRRKWAKRKGISCYRVYDADLPDYAVAIDVYEGAGADEGGRWVHIAEYAPPRDIDPERAARRLSDVLAVTPAIMGVTSDDVFLKVRRHGAGGSQYGRDEGRDPAKVSSRGVVKTTQENYLKFEVNLTDYLDTGIFLDQRLTRELVFEYAERARFLNLFAYTGTATVHAAAGGAFQTTTVDLSQTYLSWARRNMELNGFTGAEHEYVRADCLSWVEEQRHTKNRWDLIFVDPPTFSNSNSLGARAWDVQRDHVELLIGVSRLLARAGKAIFSCNLRDFKPDTDALVKAGVELTDITASTIPEDFERNPKIHHCYTLRRVV